MCWEGVVACWAPRGPGTGAHPLRGECRDRPGAAAASRPACAPRCSAHLPLAPRGSDRRAGGPRAQVAAIGQAGPGG